MSFELQLNTKLSQTLKLSPQLQQAIKVLALNNFDLSHEIYEQALTNPLLELKQGEKETKIHETESLEKLPIFSRVSGTVKVSSNTSDPEQYVSDQKDLLDELLEQISFFELSNNEKAIFYNIICNLDSDGFLSASCEQIANELNCSIKEVEKILKVIHSLEPAGIAARNLSECLLIQLERVGKQNSLTGVIVEKYLDLVAQQDYKTIAKKESCSVELVHQAIKEIKTLSPRPITQFESSPTKFIVPDLQLVKDKDSVRILINEKNMPKVSYSHIYLGLINSKKFGSKEEKKYLLSKYREASWFMKAIMQRNITLKQVAQCIFEHQSEFISNGVQSIKPLILKDIADKLGLHESTVSRAVSSKFIETPRGIYPLKYFFSSKLSSGEDEISSIVIKEKIKEIVANEDVSKPLSDQKITNYLASNGLKIARRTVSKYREELKIPSARERKKSF